MSQSNWNLLQAIGDHPEALDPLGNYLVVDLFKAEKESQGGIALPDQVSQHRRPWLARVIKAGPGQRSLMDAKPVSMWVKDGDLIVVLKHTAIEISMGTKTCHIVAEGDIVAKVDETLLKPFLDAPVFEMEEDAPVDAEPADPMMLTAGGIYVPREISD